MKAAVRRSGMALAVAAAIVAAAVTLAATRWAEADAGTPAATLKSFLVSATVDQDGVGACRYLTAHARAELARIEPPHTSCELALSSAHLQIGGDNVDSEAAVKHLSYRVARSGDLARVTCSSDGYARTFTLREGSARELGEFRAPPTSWRVDAGAETLVAPVAR